MFKFLLEEAPTNAQGGVNTGVYVIFLIGIVLLVVFPMLTQRKRTREYQAMIGSLHVGDLVKTAGGIIGKIQSISSKGELTTVVLETGSKTEKSYMEFDINMVACVLKSTKVETDETDDEENNEELDEEPSDTEAVAENTETLVETPAEEPQKVEEEQKAEPADEENKSAKKPATKKSSVKKRK